MKTSFVRLMLSVANLGFAEDGVFLRNYTTNQISLVAGFVPDASRIIVGEPLFLTFVVSNRTDQPFHFGFFYDECYTITATNAAGTAARNLHRGGGFSGGATQVSVLRSNAYNGRLLLNSWCALDQPGDYTVTCRYTFRNYSSGGEPFGPPIVSVFKLTILPADAKRLTEIIETWGRVVETNGALREAAMALAQINDPRTIPYLAVLVMKGSDINYIAVHALACFTNNSLAADALTSAL